MSKRFKTIVRKDRRITLPSEFSPGEAIEVIVRVLSPNEPLPREEAYTK
ncbi:MAG: hypothetical protein ACXABI_05170 [Candidatus Hodarchaeales archaeon]